ncbi:MAG: DUF3108 domain-containing protein [Rhodocyclaceae bacterium]|nr:MAG: DUF3108 domain-containing protein [Rhodocyclaceae bacterium]
MDLPFALTATIRMSAASPLDHRRSRRLARALLASLLIHLALVADLAGLQRWPPGISSSLQPPLAVHLAPAAAETSFPVAVGRSSRPSPSPRRIEAEPATKHPLPHSENVISMDPDGAPQDEILDRPIENQVAKPAVEQNDDRMLQRLPSSGKLVYQFYWGKSRWLAGLATHQWIVDDGNYTLSSTVATTGLFGLIHPVRLVESSQGSVVGDRLRPQMFITQLNEHPPAISYFNWDKGYFRWYRGAASFTQSLPASAYDKISFLYQLYLTPLQEDSYSTAITMGRRLEHYEIRNLGVEEVDVDGLAYPSHHLKRITTSADMEQVEIWLSTSDNLPIKMVYSNSAGDYFEQLIAAESIPVGARN